MNSIFTKLLQPIIFMYHLYADGFKNMSRMSRILWVVAVVKLMIMFGFLKVFFFESHLSQFESEEEKIEHISKQLTTLDN